MPPRKSKTTLDEAIETVGDERKQEVSDAWLANDMQREELDAAAASLAVVTSDGQSRLIEDAEVQKYLDLVEVEKTAAQTEGMELEGASS